MNLIDTAALMPVTWSARPSNVGDTNEQWSYKKQRRSS